MLSPWLTDSENIAMGLRYITDKAHCEKELHELIELIHLEGFERHYPYQLSGGMKQRVELARALAGDSDAMLMDEPLSALDYQTKLHMRRELVRLLQGRPRYRKQNAECMSGNQLTFLFLILNNYFENTYL